MPFPKTEGPREWAPEGGAPLPEFRSVASRWTTFCWWLSRKLGGRKVFGKQDFSQ